MLSDSNKRSRYDQFGHAGVDPSYGAGSAAGGNPFGDDFDIGDIFSSFLAEAFHRDARLIQMHLGVVPIQKLI